LRAKPSRRKIMLDKKFKPPPLRDSIRKLVEGGRL
jgi:hypothetical protein